VQLEQPDPVITKLWPPVTLQDHAASLKLVESKHFLLPLHQTHFGCVAQSLQLVRSLHVQSLNSSKSSAVYSSLEKTSVIIDEIKKIVKAFINGYFFFEFSGGRF
jgi:hypothetical protein